MQVRTETNKVILHCSATPPKMDIGVEEIKKWHLQRGWSDIGYHFVIRLDGTLEQGRNLHMVGAHTQGYNKASVGICYVGGLDEDMKPSDTMNEAQRKTFLGILLALRRVYGCLTLHGHNEFARKACPSFDVQTKFAAYLTESPES